MVFHLDSLIGLTAGNSPLPNDKNDPWYTLLSKRGDFSQSKVGSFGSNIVTG